MKNIDIKKLKSAAHKLNPVVIIGNNGLTESVHNEIEIAIKSHELIKIRVNASDKEERQEMIDIICERHDATLVQTIGHVAVIYREKQEDE